MSNGQTRVLGTFHGYHPPLLHGLLGDRISMVPITLILKGRKQDAINIFEWRSAIEVEKVCVFDEAVSLKIAYNCSLFA